MQAALILGHGGREQIAVRDVPVPVPGPDEVLVRVRACALNHLDVLLRRGLPTLRVPLPHIGGGDVAGEIAALGPGVGGWAPGDRVLLYPISPGQGLGEQRPGGLAECVTCPAADCLALPDEVDIVQAAALPIAYGTAWHMLVNRAALQPGEAVVVLGAAGGVGTAAVQIAALLGARVIAIVAGPAKAAAVSQLGVDAVVDRSVEPRWSQRVLTLTDGQGAAVVVDMIGRETWAQSLRACAPGGRVVTCGAVSGHLAVTDLRYLFHRQLALLGANGFQREDLATVLALVQSGALHPVIDRVLPLTEVAEGHRLIEERAVIGKIVIQPGEP